MVLINQHRILLGTLTTYVLKNLLLHFFNKITLWLIMTAPKSISQVRLQAKNLQEALLSAELQMTLETQEFRKPHGSFRLSHRHLLLTRRLLPLTAGTQNFTERLLQLSGNSILLPTFLKNMTVKLTHLQFLTEFTLCRSM